MFYLKYRPRTIAEIDNTKPRDTIASVLKSSPLPHAFLFIGPKGTGKTSTARIFAKSISCLNNAYGNKKSSSIEPCNGCENCKSIDSSTFPDVREMDAASNRGINEVKELIRETSLMPMVGKYRIYIIDEAHMITHDGFNALLKTLEEPPESVIFVLATTNKEKVPKTIQSRCVEVQFGSAQTEELIHMLQRIVQAEKIQVDKAVLQLIAQHCESSFRDGAKLLEEIVMTGKTDLDSASTIIGIRSKETLYKAFFLKDAKKTLSWIKQFSEDGGNIKTLLEEILSDLQSHLLHLNGIQTDKTKLNFSLKETITCMKLLTDAYAQLRSSPFPTIPLEVALLEFYNKEGYK